MASLAEVLRQVGYVTPQGVTGPNAPLAQQLKNYATNVIPTARQNLVQQRADIDAALTMGQRGVQIGDREAFERQMAQVPNLMGLTAYHGTPHTIKGKFDISKVGTGEGAQAYGHGMYFAENPAVAKEYQNMLRGPEGTAQHYLQMYKTPEIAISALEGGITPNLTAEAKKHSLDAINVLKSGKELKGNLYKVDIPDADIPNMMDYYKPLSEQPQAVKDIAMKYANGLKNQIGFKGVKSIWELDGGDLYGVMQRYQINNAGKLVKKNVDAKDVSDKLLNAGIKGIRYLDQGSLQQTDSYLAKHGGTSNFVVFDPSNVKILEQNSKPMTRKEIIEQELKKVVE